MKLPLVDSLAKRPRQPASAQTHHAVERPSQRVVVNLGSLSLLDANLTDPLLTVIESAVSANRLHGGLHPLPFPHPTRPSTVRNVVAAPQKALPHSLSATATTSSDPLTFDGTLQCRQSRHFNNKYITRVSSHRLPTSPSGELLHSTPPNGARTLPNDIMTLTAPSLDALATYTADYNAHSVYRLRVDTSFKTEVKRQGKIDSYQAVFDNSHRGSAKFLYIPGKKVLASFIVRQALLTSRCLSSTPLGTDKNAGRLNTVFQPADIQRQVIPPSLFVGGTEQFPETLDLRDRLMNPVRALVRSMRPGAQHNVKTVTLSKSAVAPSADEKGTDKQTDKVKDKKSSLDRRSKKKTHSEETITVVNNGRRNIKLDAEYLLKEKKYMLYTMLEGTNGRELSLRLYNNPLKVIPKIRMPIGPNPNAWVFWMPNLQKSLLGEMGAGYGELSMSAVWAQGLLNFAQRNQDGSALAVSLIPQTRSAKIDRTLVTKALKGKVTVTVNGTMGNQKDQTGLALSLNHSPSSSSLSVYGKTSRSFGFSLDSNFKVRNHCCRLALRTDDLKNSSIRLGLFS